jgi:hypothetical protein
MDSAALAFSSLVSEACFSCPSKPMGKRLSQPVIAIEQIRILDLILDLLFKVHYHYPRAQGAHAFTVSETIP